MFSSNDPFLQYTHDPNCSVVTDDELASTVHGVWPNSNGKTTINYIFSLPAYWWLYANPFEYHLRNLNTQTVNAFTESVRYVISKIQTSNNGILNFREITRSFKTDFSPFFRGIYYAQTASETQFTEDDSGAFTYIQFDNNGYIKRALVHMPTDYNIYNDSQNIYQPFWSLYALCHESYHALGGEHLQDFPAILAQLQATLDGVFCSVMDYPNIVGTNISNCYQNCTPQFAALPGPLDIRSVQLAYLQGKYDLGYNKGAYYFWNAVELSLFFVFISFSYAIIYNVLTALFVRENSFISKTTFKNYIEFFLNIALVGLLAEMETPAEVTILFSLFTGLKLIPQAALAKIRCYRPNNCFERMTRWKYPLFVLGFSASFSEGKVALAIFLTGWLSLSALFIGNLAGKLLMTFLLFLASKSFNAAWALVFPEDAMLPADENDIAPAIEIELMEPNASRHVNNQELEVSLLQVEEKPGMDDLRITVPTSSRPYGIASYAVGEVEAPESGNSISTTPSTPTTISALSSPRTPSTASTLHSPRSPWSPASPRSAKSPKQPSTPYKISESPRAFSTAVEQEDKPPANRSPSHSAERKQKEVSPKNTSAANFPFYRPKEDSIETDNLKTKGNNSPYIKSFIFR